MLEKIVTLYRKAEMGIVGSLAGITNKVLEETNFYDIGYMQTQINRIKKELNRVSKELQTNLELNNDSDYAKNQQTELIKQRENLLFHMIFIASNSFANLNYCEDMANGHDFIFIECVKGLQEYKNGNKEKAFKILENYYQQYGSVEEHFLINKIFGQLLTEKEIYQKAIPFLTYTLQFVPDDIEALEALQLCYQKTKQLERKEIISEILSVLE